jgi:hypothetical protein
MLYIIISLTIEPWVLAQQLIFSGQVVTHFLIILLPFSSPLTHKFSFLTPSPLSVSLT